MSEELVKKLSAEVYRQYISHRDWDDAKDAIEGIDYNAIAGIVLDHHSATNSICAESGVLAFLKAEGGNSLDGSMVTGTCLPASSAALSKMRNQYCLHFDDLMNAYAEVLARSCSHRSGIQAVVESLRDEIIPERMIISSQSVVHAADLRLFFREILAGGVEKVAGGSNSNASAPTCGGTAPAAVCIWTHESIAGGRERPINTYRRSCDQNRCTIYHSIERCTGCGKEISINGGLP